MNARSEAIDDAAKLELDGCSVKHRKVQGVKVEEVKGAESHLRVHPLRKYLCSQLSVFVC